MKNLFKKFYVAALIAFALFTTSCSGGGIKGVVMPDAVGVVQIEVSRLSEDIGGFEQFTGMLDRSSKQLYDAFDQQTPIVISVDAEGVTAISFSLKKGEQLIPLLEELLGEQVEAESRKVGKWELFAAPDEYGVGAAVAQRSSEVVIIASTTSELTSESINRAISGDKPKYFTSSQLSKLNGNDVAILVDYSTVMELAMEMNYELSDILTQEVLTENSDVIYLATQNFEAGEIRFDTEVFNIKQEFKGKVSKDIFNYIPQSHVGFMMAADLGFLEEFLAEYAELYIQALDLEEMEPFFNLFQGQTAIAVKLNEDMPKVMLAMEVEPQAAEELLMTSGMSTVQEAGSNADKFFSLRISRNEGIYAALYGDMLLLSTDKGDVLSNKGVSPNASSSPAAKSIVGSLAGAIIDLESVIEMLPYSTQRSLRHSGVMPLLEMVSSVEMIAHSATTTKGRIIFKDSKTNALQSIKDEAMSFIYSNF